MNVYWIQWTPFSLFVFFLYIIILFSDLSISSRSISYDLCSVVAKFVTVYLSSVSLFLLRLVLSFVILKLVTNYEISVHQEFWYGIKILFKALYIYKALNRIFYPIYIYIYISLLWWGALQYTLKKIVLYSTKSGSRLIIIGEPLLVLYSTISLKVLYSTFVKWCYEPYIALYFFNKNGAKQHQQWFFGS